MSAMNRDERQPSPASVERVLLVVVAFLTSGVILHFFYPLTAALAAAQGISASSSWREQGRSDAARAVYGLLTPDRNSCCSYA